MIEIGQIAINCTKTVIDIRNGKNKLDTRIICDSTYKNHIVPNPILTKQKRSIESIEYLTLPLKL